MKTESNARPATDPAAGADARAAPDAGVDPGRPRRRRVAWLGAALAVGLAVASIAVPNLLTANLNANESAAIATLKKLRDRHDEIYGHVDDLGRQMEEGLRALFAKTDLLKPILSR